MDRPPRLLQNGSTKANIKKSQMPSRRDFVRWDLRFLIRYQIRPDLIADQKSEIISNPGRVSHVTTNLIWPAVLVVRCTLRCILRRFFSCKQQSRWMKSLLLLANDDFEDPSVNMLSVPGMDEPKQKAAAASNGDDSGFTNGPGVSGASWQNAKETSAWWQAF
jgi:hypothetical protein